MAVPWGLVVVVIGVVYGYAKPGKQSKWDIFKTGLLIGIVLGLVFGVLGWFTGLASLGAGLVGDGFWGTLVSVVWLTILFIVGVFVGDLLE